MQIVLDGIESFSAYGRSLENLVPERFNEAIAEPVKRMGQMHRLLELIAAGEKLVTKINSEIFVPPLEARARYASDEGFIQSQEMKAWQEALTLPESKNRAAEAAATVADLELFCESFYWIAGRARVGIRQLPGLQSFEAKGIRNVRNKLLEYPEGSDSGVLFGGFSIGGSQGPVVKAVRLETQKDLWVDAGLYVNVSEFFENLRGTASRLIAEPRLLAEAVTKLAGIPEDRGSSIVFGA